MIEIILASLITYQTQTKTLEGQNGKLQHSIHLLSTGSNINRDFILGDSVQQLEEKKKQSDRKLVAEKSKRGQSYTGTGGEVERVYWDTTNNCVQFAKAQTGINRTIGAGGRSGINTSQPQLGAIGVEKQKPHAVYIEKIEGDQITIIESNYIKNWITRRVLSRSDFIGFII